MLLNFLNPPILGLPLAIILLLLIITIPLIVIYLFLRLTEAAFEQIGFDHWHATLAVFGSFIGSLIDIPLSTGTISSYPGWYITLASTIAPGFPTYFHPFYLAINMGGAIVPLIISAHLILTRRVSASKAGIGILVVALITYFLAQPVAGEGIVLPFWLSPIISGNLRSSLITRLLWCTIDCIYKRLDGNPLGCRYYEYSDSRSASCSLTSGIADFKATSTIYRRRGRI